MLGHSWKTTASLQKARDLETHIEEDNKEKDGKIRYQARGKPTKEQADKERAQLVEKMTGLRSSQSMPTNSKQETSEHSETLDLGDENAALHRGPKITPLTANEIARSGTCMQMGPLC